MGIIIIPVLITALFLFGGRIVTGGALKYLSVKKTEAVKVDKSDPKWLKEYCRGEIKNLPMPPFKITKLDGDVHFLSVPDVSLSAIIPNDKWYDTVTS